MIDSDHAAVIDGQKVPFPPTVLELKFAANPRESPIINPRNPQWAISCEQLLVELNGFSMNTVSFLKKLSGELGNPYLVTDFQFSP